ncbi:MAG: YceI family protein [Agriterribacter sp.]
MAKTTWSVDLAHSELSFKIKHLMISNVSGTFGQFEITAETEKQDFSEAKISVKIDPASINTNNIQRDAHLRNQDFFEVDKYPEILFQSTTVEPLDAENFVLYGNLTLRGVTKPVKLNVEFNGILGKDPWGLQRAGFLVTGKISRNDYGLTFNSLLESGGVALGDEVKITGDIQLVKQEAVVAAA